MTPRKWLGVAFLTGASVIWGGSVVAQKIALQNWNPYFVLWVRGLGTLAVLIPYAIYGSLINWKNLAGDFPRLFWLSLTGLGNSLFVICGLQFTTASEAGMIMGTNPILMAILLKLSGKQSLDSKGWLAALTTVSGVILVVLHPEDGSKPVHLLLGDLLVFLGVLSWTVYTLLGKDAMSRHSPLSISMLTWIGAIMITPLAFGTTPLPNNHSVAGIAALVYIVLIATVLAFFLWLSGLHEIGSAHSTVYLNLIPLSAILFSALLLGESIQWRQWMGGGLILTGAGLITHFQKEAG